MFVFPIADEKVSKPVTAPAREKVPVPVVAEVSLTLSFTTNAI